MTQRGSGRLISAWLTVSALIGPLAAAQAQTFLCTRDTAGQLSPQAGVRCRCERVAEGGITGAEASYAWDCGVLRGRMNQLVPPAPPPSQGLPLDAVIVEAPALPGHLRHPRGAAQP